MRRELPLIGLLVYDFVYVRGNDRRRLTDGEELGLLQLRELIPHRDPLNAGLRVPRTGEEMNFLVQIS